MPLPMAGEAPRPTASFVLLCEQVGVFGGLFSKGRLALSRRRFQTAAAPTVRKDAAKRKAGGDASASDVPSEDGALNKRGRPNQVCYKCGGNGHIAEMCPSRDGARNSSMPECHLCNGRGHMKANCPNNVPRGVCYKCGVYGHSGRSWRRWSWFPPRLSWSKLSGPGWPRLWPGWSRLSSSPTHGASLLQVRPAWASYGIVPARHKWRRIDELVLPLWPRGTHCQELLQPDQAVVSMEMRGQPLSFSLCWVLGQSCNGDRGRGGRVIGLLPDHGSQTKQRLETCCVKKIKKMRESESSAVMPTLNCRRGLFFDKTCTLPATVRRGHHSRQSLVPQTRFGKPQAHPPRSRRPCPCLPR
eukprot:m.309716 g.309716  ORF g.309716 m.309716 type:complete len:357 (-) comp19644_c0_seq8:815-1885(-)